MSYNGLMEEMHKKMMEENKGKERNGYGGLFSSPPSRTPLPPAPPAPPAQSPAGGIKFLSATKVAEKQREAKLVSLADRIREGISAAISRGESYSKIPLERGEELDEEIQQGLALAGYTCLASSDKVGSHQGGYFKVTILTVTW
jgi:hypothetical protein